MMIPVGFCTITFSHQTIEDALHLSADAGALGVEIWGRGHLSTDATRSEIARVKQLADTLHLAIPTYGSYLTAGSAEWSDARVDNVLARMVDLGVIQLRVWAGEHGSLEATSEEWTCVATTLQRWGDLAAARHVTLIVERHCGTLTDETAPARTLLERVNHPHVRLNYQVAMPWPDESYSTRITDDLCQLLPLSSAMHLQNYYSVEKKLARAPLADGIVDYSHWRPLLDAAAFSGWAMLEFLPDTSTEALATLARQEITSARILLETADK